MHTVQYCNYQQTEGFQKCRRGSPVKLCEQRLKLWDILPVHSGCVNSIAWDEYGRRLVSGSDDRQLVITDPFTEPRKRIIATIPSGHRANIFSAKFLPGLDTVVSCSSEGSVMVTDIDCSDTYGKNVFMCHTGATYEIATVIDDPHTFLTCGEDGCIRWIDRRLKSCCHAQCTDDVIVRCQRAVNAIDVGYFRPKLLAAGCSDATVRLYDLRKVDKNTTDNLGMVGFQSCFISPSQRPRRVTSVDISRESNDDHVLASYASDGIYCFCVKQFANESEKISLSALMNDDQIDQVRKVRLRGDWSDTGPRSRPAAASADGSAADPDHGGSVDAENTGIAGISRALTNMFSTHVERSANELASTYETEAGSSRRRPRDECRARILEEARRRRAERRRQLAELLDAVPQHKMAGAYYGHRNARTVLKQAAFWGPDHIVSGSDCGHVFIWNRHTGRVTNILEADRRVVNCVQPHPTLPVLATSGIDYDIKLWAPIEPEPVDRQAEIDGLVERNKVMLEETRDTVTIPAMFMLRMIAAMNRYRREHRPGESNEGGESDDSA